MFKSLKLISFDINNTLIRVSRDVGLQYAKVGATYGLESENNDSVQKLNNSFRKIFKKYDKELPNFGYSKNITSIEWWSRMVEDTFKDAGFTKEGDQEKINQTAAHLYKLYSRGTSWHPKEGAQNILLELRKQRPEIDLAVVSNFDERLETILRDLDLRQYFRFMFISRAVGLAKPDPKFFQHVIKTVGVRPEEYLHIGDNTENDYSPVREIKANALIVNPDIDDPNFSNVDPIYIVPSLKELKHLLLTD